jgi:hypothetical protein
MHPTRHLFPCLVIGVLSLGCGDSSHINARGRVLKGGQPYVLPEGQGLRIFFVPLDLPAGTHFDSYAAEYDPDNGSFEVKGKDRRGLPAGRYRVDLQLMEKKEDLLNGGLLGKKSPFVCEVTGKDDLVIDLDQAKFDSLLAEAKKPKQNKPVQQKRGRGSRGAVSKS